MLEAVLALAVSSLQDALPAFDWSAFGVNLIQAIVPVVTTLAIWGGRKLLENTPRTLIPIVAVVLGTALDLLTAYISGGTFNPVVGGLLGAAAVWLHQVISVYAEFGLGSRANTRPKTTSY